MHTRNHKFGALVATCAVAASMLFAGAMPASASIGPESATSSPAIELVDQSSNNSQTGTEARKGGKGSGGKGNGGKGNGGKGNGGGGGGGGVSVPVSVPVTVPTGGSSGSGGSSGGCKCGGSNTTIIIVRQN